MPRPRRAYDVGFDLDALTWIQVGPMFARYSLPLTGTLDKAWTDCYRRASFESAEFSRFHLDAETRTVSFTCRAEDGPARIQSTLERLSLLVAFVNQRTYCPQAAPQAVSG